MSATDQILAKMIGEIEDRQQFIDGLVQAANDEKKDLSPDKLELIERAGSRINELNERMKPLEEARRISGESADRIASLAKFMSREGDKPTKMEYRSAGEYVLDRWRAGLGEADAAHRLDLYHRAAAHQTTTDNPGLLPAPIIDPVVSFVDSNRALVSALGPRNMPGATWTRPKVTQHTSVAVQSAEKAELVSQKMTIAKLTGTAATYGGYVNVSRQDVDFTQPGIMDLVISDLAAQYATAATAGSTLPTGANTADQISAALWAAAAAIYTATKGAGRVFAVIPPGLLAGWGPLFPPVNPTNQQSAGFSGADFSSGLVGNIAGIPIYVSPAVASNTGLVLSSAAGEVYEDRIGSLQVVEPSVLGVQVAYAGYFTPLVIEATGIIKITKTP
jgi:HK97 family phage major capsid protein